MRHNAPASIATNNHAPADPRGAVRQLQPSVPLDEALSAEPPAPLDADEADELDAVDDVDEPHSGMPGPLPPSHVAGVAGA